ncbi:diguanylate cyclase domain-containing protein [Isoalcanivorax pacificus]|uniref:diguanylate cyclase domain-containing protein n=1 Tax=Isoalcanivorax pacificus TaxID=1306787 RepID=UPI0009E3A84A|nr:diguanylate cyclase [Isoalcanivorax pacificus]
MTSLPGKDPVQQHPPPDTPVAQLDRLTALLHRPIWLLRFPAALEQPFWRRQQPAQVLAARIGVLVGIPLYLITTLIEWRTDPALLRLTLPTRALAIGLLLLVGVAASCAMTRRHLAWIVPLAILLLNSLQLYICRFSAPAYQAMTLLWMLLPLTFMSTVSRVPFRCALWVGLCTAGGFLLCSARFSSLSGIQLYHTGFFFLSFILILLLSHFFNERLQRQRFLQASLLNLHRRGLHRPDPGQPEVLQPDRELGVVSRAALDQRLRKHFAYHHPPRIAVVICTLDHFDTLVATYSEHEALFCLATVARTAQRMVAGSGDFVARRGDRSLALVLEGGNGFDALHLAERLRRQVEAMGIPHFGSPSQVITLSGGVAASEHLREPSADTLLQAADQALSRALAAGGNRSEAWRSA